MARVPRKSPVKRLSAQRAAANRAAEEVIVEAEPEIVIVREDLRAPIREEDPRARADRRAQEILGHGSFSAGTSDQFYIDPDSIPDGWTYEWKRAQTVNKNEDAYGIELRRNGWEPVPSGRHPELMPPGVRDETITRNGMILMERPAEVTETVRRMELNEARELQRLPHQLAGESPRGTFERRNKDSSLHKIKSSFEPIMVPEN